MSLKKKSYELNQVMKIEVNCKIFKIRIMESPSEQIEFSWSDSVMRTLGIKENNGTISVADHAAIGIYGTLALIDLKKDAQFLIKIPKTYSGKIVLQTKEEIVHVTDVDFQGNLGISTNTGEILLENVTARLIDIRANVGKTNCYGIDASDAIYISSTRGNILCNLCGEESAYTISCTTSNRRNNMTGTYGDGKKNIQLNSEHGEIQYTCLNGKAAMKPRSRYNRRHSFKEW